MESNHLIKLLSDYAMGRFIDGAEACARRTKDDYPSQDDSLGTSHLLPQI